jgi:phosphoenolpyruvate carboxylase
MLETDGVKITKCPFDVTGLFETVGDLKTAPGIVHDLLSIPIIRQFICEHRDGKLTVMMGYSGSFNVMSLLRVELCLQVLILCLERMLADSVRDGSSLASDAQIARTSLQLQAVEQMLNADHSKGRVRLVFYRGRGDTIPRGYGGSTSKAIASQLVTTQEEDHTEQNRFLRRYASYVVALMPTS